MDPGESEFPCVGTLETGFEGLEGGDVQGFVQVRAVKIQAELCVDPFDIGKVGNVVEGLGGEDSRNTDGMQPRGGPHSELGDGIVEFESQRLEVSRVGRDEVEFLNVVERKLGDVLWILCAGKADGDLREIGGVEEGDVLEGDIVGVPVQGAEIREEDMIGSDITERRPGGECEVAWPGPLDLEVAHNSTVSIDTSPFVLLRSTFKILNTST